MNIGHTTVYKGNSTTPPASNPTQGPRTLSRQEAIHLTKMNPLDRRYENLQRLLLFYDTGIHATHDGIKVNATKEESKLLGGAEMVVFAGGALSAMGAMGAMGIVRSVLLDTILKVVKKKANDCYQSVRNYFSGRGFRTNNAVKANDLREALAQLSPAQKIEIMRSLGLAD